MSLVNLIYFLRIGVYSGQFALYLLARIKIQAEFNASSEATAMNSNGEFSYALNSSRQKRGSDLVIKTIIREIAENISITHLLSSSTVFKVADLGCSTGPNTFFTVHDIIQATEAKYVAEGQKNPEDLEFQVFFSDQTVNDFNALFRSLPSQRRYFVTGVPGSFYGRLFPKESLHFVYSAYALQWLSMVPEDVLDRASPAWNNARISYEKKEVEAAFLAQHTRDLACFLTARAQEIVSGGIIALLVPGRPDNIDPSKCRPIAILSVLGSALLDMANQGLLDEAKVDNFNLPLYFPSLNELKKAIEIDGHFAIRKVEAVASSLHASVATYTQKVINNLRSVTEVLLTKHFGHEVMDELFDRFAKKTVESGIFQNPSYVPTVDLFVFLTRISDN